MCCKKIHSASLLVEIKIGAFGLKTNVCDSCLNDLIEKVKCELGIDEEEDKKDNSNV